MANSKHDSHINDKLNEKRHSCQLNMVDCNITRRKQQQFQLCTGWKMLRNRFDFLSIV